MQGKRELRGGGDGPKKQQARSAGQQCHVPNYQHQVAADVLVLDVAVTEVDDCVNVKVVVLT